MLTTVSLRPVVTVSPSPQLDAISVGVTAGKARQITSGEMKKPLGVYSWPLLWCLRKRRRVRGMIRALVPMGSGCEARPVPRKNAGWRPE